MLYVQSYPQVTVDSLETLPDGSIVVRLGAVEYRGFNAEAMRGILKVQSDYKVLKEENETLIKTFNEYRINSQELLDKVNEEWSLKILKEKQESEFWKGEFAKEKELRVKYENIVDGCSGKIIFVRFCI